MTNTKSNELYSVCYLRCFSMFLIVLCHLAQKSSNVYIQMSSQFLNVGVSIFFIISGYLFGLRKIEIEYKKWYLKRIIRILPSFYLFLIILFCIYLILKKDIRLTSWIIYLFDLQAFLGYVRGAEHLWFLSIIAICYFITPILDWIKSNLKKTTKLFLFSLIILFQIIVTFFIEKQLGIYLFKVNIYILAYIFGSVKFECENLSEFIFSLVLCLLGASLRISGKIMIDGTVMYDVMLVGITQAMIAFGLFFSFQFLFNREPRRIIKFFDKISFEVYLVHYMFVVGPISLMNITKSYLVNCLLVVICSLGLASLVSEISIYLSKKVN